MYKRYVKRILDTIISMTFLICFSPFILILAILIRIKLGSPIIFKQERPGQNEKIFRLYKFRTMTNETDEKGELLADEVRLTHFGKLLRATSLDEIPELWNVVKGEMSLVGPRPLLVRYLPYYTDEERKRHNVRPGLTGLAQINGRNTIAWEERFAYDVDYAENISFRTDLSIIFNTVRKVFSKSGSEEVTRADMREELNNSADYDFDVYRRMTKEKI